MPLTNDLEFFKLSEFKHPEIVDAYAAHWLNEIRREFGKPLVITDDGRPPGTRPSGSSATSLHFTGRAFDLRIRHFSREDLWDFTRAVMAVAKRIPVAARGIELELVWSARDKHAHVGFFFDGRADRLIVAAD